MENKLSVNNLTISFKTSNGKVQAVRGVSFDLAKGETLAIVGESGSGKSVTSKAILGILAGNAIVEGGEIIYDGKDLLKISEEDFHKIRGDKIAMIFQDPMSSLNPIVKIGKQLTEAMLLKGKARQRESRRNFNTYLKLLERNMLAAEASEGDAKKAEILEKCKSFDKFEYKHLELQGAYAKAHEAAEEFVADVEPLLFELEKNAAKDLSYRVGRLKHYAQTSIQTYVVDAKADRVRTLAATLSPLASAARKKGESTELRAALTELKEILSEAISFPEPNFFAMGYYMTFSKEPLPALPVPELNLFLRKFLDEQFMLSFIADAKQALVHSAMRSRDHKAALMEALEAYRPVFTKESLDRVETKTAIKSLTEKAEAAIDHLEITKDSMLYTFSSSIQSESELYFHAIQKNQKEQKRYEREMARRDRLTAKGKEPDWQVVPAAITDLALVRGSILSDIDHLHNHLSEQIEAFSARDFDSETVAVIDYLKMCASGVVNKVTKAMAKQKALKLMEEVGIPEPRKRYNQYPFEFSGGMRQRIVIAIALAANPDILICDEPTTALDVTIQAQILELINRLKEERKLSIIFITHDLGVVANMADRIAVMYAGKIVEYGTAEDVFYHSAHPYTWALLSSMPDLDTNEKLDAIPGTPPNMIYPPKGDAFAPRNKYAMKIDFERQPPMFQISDTHYAATWLLHPDAPKVDPPKIVTDRIARMQNKGGAGDE